MIKLFQHLLPNAKAWRITINKNLRKFFQGLSNSIVTPIITYVDTNYLNLFPRTTNLLAKWQEQLGIRFPWVVNQRTQLLEEWGLKGGQTLQYIQAKLQNEGFMVYLHEFYDGLITRDPNTYLAPNTITPPTVNQGYPLVNKVYKANKNYISRCGNPISQCGEPLNLRGNFLNYLWDNKYYEIPSNPIYYPYFLYIGDQTFPNKVTLSIADRERFEALCLKLCPTHLWLGILVDYV